MRLALWFALAALPLAAQPKLLVNAQTDTRSAVQGLEREFESLLKAQPQPAWIAYSVPVQKGRSLGCELVNPSSGPLGVVHLEPPDTMVVLFRVREGAVERVRSYSPYCEIDAGNLPFHWLTGVDPAASANLLMQLVKTAKNQTVRKQALSALGAAADPQATALLLEFVKK